ncbi:MAG: hypothetical protein IID31_11190 [Planctomycetes bacterium]|nr:hypothetical protein [Planctomycetota bacterium]
MIGLTGFGKTTRLRERVHSVPRLVAFDPVVTPERPRGQLDLPHRFTDGRACAAFIRARPRPRMLRVALHSADWADFSHVAAACLAAGGDMIVALDELRLLCHQKWNAGDGKGVTAFKAHPWVDWLFSESRNYGIEVFWTAQRPEQVGRICTSQSEVFEVFRVAELSDLDAIRPRFRRADFRAIPHLQKFEFVTNGD